MAKFVSKQDIVREYSDTVARLLATGWTIFTPSMAGSQGEDAHVDLINADHTVVYRVLLYTESGWGDGCDHKYIVEVRSYVPEDVRVTSWDDTWDLSSHSVCIWNNRGNEVSKLVFYAMGQNGRGRNVHYTTDASVPAQAKARREYKYKNNLYADRRWDTKIAVKISAAKLVKFIKVHGGRGYGNCKADEIKSVHKYDRDGQMRYIIEFVSAKKNLVF